MAVHFLLGVAAFTVFANALAHNAPRSTNVAESQEWDWRGWTPAPTAGPKSPHELLRRGFALEGRAEGTTILVAEDQTCGYLSGSAGAAYTCGGSSTCNLFTDVGAVACCGATVCSAALACVNSLDYHSSSLCNDECDVNTFTLKCTGLAFPFCNTVTFPEVDIKDFYCASRSVTSIQTISTNYRGQTFGGSFSEQVLTGTDSESISTPTPTPPPTPSPNTPTPLSPTTPTPTAPNPVPTTSVASSSPTPVGPIVGGVIGGVAVLALIGFGIFFFWRRNRNKKNAANQAQPQMPPPTYGQQEMGGGYAVNKPVMQTNQQEFYNPQQNQVPIEGYYNQPNQGGLSPKPGEQYPDRSQTISPVSPQLNRESYVSAPGYDGSYPQQVHEVSGQPIQPKSG